MSEYLVEEVRAEADRHARVFDEVPMRMLNAYADLLERIKADEGAVPVAFRFLGPDGEAVTEWEDAPITDKKFPDLCPSIESVQYAYLHPPAQAAQGEVVAFKHPAAVRSAATFLLGKFEHAPCDSSGVSCCIRCSAVAMSRWTIEALDSGVAAKPRAVPEAPRTIYDQRVTMTRTVEAAAPRLYVALKNLLAAIEERSDRAGIESVTIQEAHSALLAAAPSPGESA